MSEFGIPRPHNLDNTNALVAINNNNNNKNNKNNNKNNNNTKKTYINLI